MHSLLGALEYLNLVIFYEIVFAVFILPAGSLADCRYELTFFNFLNSSIVDGLSLKNHTFVDQTKQCYDDLSKNVAQTEEIASCSPGDLEVSLSPYSVLPVGTNISPHATLNITITAFVPVERLFIQFHCLHAPDAEDVYCHDHERQIAKWGRMVWPCRELQLDNYSDTSTSTTLNYTTPFRLTYNCFRLFSLSHYEVNITTWPKPCRMSFIATIPVIQHLEPRVREFIDFKGDEKFPPSAQPNWSPLLYVDVSSTDGVWIRFEPTAWISQTFHNYISIVIFERSPVDEKTHLLLTKKIGPTKNGFRWENVAAGEYLVYAFVEKINCQLSCEFTETSGLTGKCKICPHTSINFTLTEDRFTPEWRQSTRVMGIAKAIGIGIFINLVIIVIGLLAVLFYLRVWRPWQLARLPPESIELTAKPTVLLLYTDDCEEHSNAVMALANLLTEDANAKVLIDQTDLQDPSIRPSVWLLNSVAEAEFIILIFSEGSKQVMNGKILGQRRPFPDLFNTALGYVVAKINDLASTSASTNLNRRPLLANENPSNANVPKTQSAGGARNSATAPTMPSVPTQHQDEPAFHLKLNLDRFIEFKSDKLLSGPVYADVSLTNPTNVRQVYKIKCTSNEIFRVRPPVSFLQPGETVVIKITLSIKTVPDISKHFFAFYHMAAPETTDNTVAKQMWTATSKAEGKKRVPIKLVKTNGSRYKVSIDTIFDDQSSRTELRLFCLRSIAIGVHGIAREFAKIKEETRPLPELKLAFDANKQKNRYQSPSSSLLNMEKRTLKSQLSRFIVARFAYSSEDVIPEFFDHDRFGKFVIPQDIGLLIGRVHGVVGNRSSNFEYTADLESLNSTIETFENFTKENSDWLEQRTEKGITTDSGCQEEQEEKDGKRGGKHRLADHLERLTSRRTDKIPTLEEQALLADKFGLLKPEELDDVGLQDQESGIEASQNNVTTNEPKKFQVVGKLEDFCSSSSSLSSRESN